MYLDQSTFGEVFIITLIFISFSALFFLLLTVIISCGTFARSTRKYREGVGAAFLVEVTREGSFDLFKIKLLLEGSKALNYIYLKVTSFFLFFESVKGIYCKCAVRGDGVCKLGKFCMSRKKWLTSWSCFETCQKWKIIIGKPPSFI